MSRKRGGAADDPRWRSHIEPAPGDLRIVQALINSAGADSEELGSARELAAWLRGWDLLAGDAELEPADLDSAREVRSALRSLIAARGGSAPEPGAIEVLERAAAAAPLGVRFHGAGDVRLEPVDGGLHGAFARLFQIVALAHRDGIWQRLSLCAREGCGAAFYDYSNARSAKWCSARCGDKGTARTYRQRRKRYQAQSH